VGGGDMSWPGFLAGGDYAVYVWGSYGLTLIAMGGEVLLLRRRRRTWRGGSFKSTTEHTGHTEKRKNPSSR